MAVVLLDGGLGQELVRRAGDRPTPLWSTQVMVDHPGLVAEVHRDFGSAGATITTTNTYALHRDRLAGTPLEGAYDDLHRRAREEIANSGAQRVAGSIGPLGSSYRADVMPPHDEAVERFAECARALADYVDVIICETVVSLAQIKAVLEGASAGQKPIWISLSTSETDGTVLRSGEPLEEALPLLGAAAAVLINCTAPEVVPAGLDIIARTEKPYGAYANAFVRIDEAFLVDKPTVDALSARADLTPERYADHAMAWVAQGATIVGGCCEVGPEHIAEIARRLRADGHQIT